MTTEKPTPKVGQEWEKRNIVATPQPTRIVLEMELPNGFMVASIAPDGTLSRRRLVLKRTLRTYRLVKEAP